MRYEIEPAENGYILTIQREVTELASRMVFDDLAGVVAELERREKARRSAESP